MKYYLAIIFLLLSSCSQTSVKKGTLFVHSKSEGEFELYKIAENKNLQFTAELIGQYNQSLSLIPGKYMVLADCSSKQITINAGQQVELVTHKLNFTPPSTFVPSDLFVIHCERFENESSKQSHLNNFSLNILSGKRELLVGMVPVKIDHNVLDHDSPKVHNLDLSSITIDSFKGMARDLHFFVSPSDQLISVTISQRFGSRLLLLPGTYVVEIGGTKNEVTLKTRMEHEIKPAFLRLVTDKDVNTSLSSRIKGEPIYAILNDHHHIDINTTYPVMPGRARIQLFNSTEVHHVDLVGDQESKLNLRSVLVKSDCPPWDWTCLGRTKIFLFRDTQLNPFLEGITDVPLLFVGDKVSLSIQGSKGIKVRLDDVPTYQTMRAGKVDLIPSPRFQPNIITHLVRIESVSSRTYGQSLDLSLTRRETIPLIIGHYDLASYTSQKTIEGTRQRHSQKFQPLPGKDSKVYFTVYRNKNTNSTPPIFLEKGNRSRPIQERSDLMQSRYLSPSSNQ